MTTIKLLCQTDLLSWHRVPRLHARAQKAARALWDELPRTPPFSATANILFTGNAALRRLNRDFRGVDRPTNVLSFPQFVPKDLRRLAGEGVPASLGDIALAYQTVVIEARRDDKVVGDHVSHLVVHGLLHLLGYDHMTQREATTMESLEQKIMASLGLPDPYAYVLRKKRRP